MANSSNAASHWGFFVDSDMLEKVGDISRECGEVRPWVFFLPPEFVAITFFDGIWDEVGNKCDLVFDNFEECELRAEQARAVASIIRESSARYVDGEIERVIGQSEGASREPIVATAQGQELRRVLENLSLFLKTRAALGKSVTCFL